MSTVMVTQTFQKLDDSNYSFWSIRMEAELVRKGFWDLITGDEECPEDPKEEGDGKQPTAAETTHIWKEQKEFQRRQAEC
jgi:hypothetical protein